jgi:uncharacterized membrane protein YeaQ/YmgE (transglycosylase-associated protein family)
VSAGAVLAATEVAGFVDLVSWAVFGFFVGAVARLIVPGRQPIGLLWTLTLGVAGAILGGMAAEELLDVGETGAFDFESFVAGVIVATFLVATAAALLRRG